MAGGSRSRDNWWRGGHSNTPSVFLFLFGAAFGCKNVIQCDSDRLKSQRSVTSIHSPGQNMIQCITDWMEYVISRNGAKFLILIVPRLLLFPALITTQHIYSPHITLTNASMHVFTMLTHAAVERWVKCKCSVVCHDSTDSSRHGREGETALILGHADISSGDIHYLQVQLIREKKYFHRIFNITRSLIILFLWTLYLNSCYNCI